MRSSKVAKEDMNPGGEPNSKSQGIVLLSVADGFAIEHRGYALPITGLRFALFQFQKYEHQLYV